MGIVTALEIDLVAAPAQWGATLTFDVADAASVLRAVRDLADDAPATLNVFVNSMRMPDAPQLPAEIRGTSFLSVQALSVDGAAGALLSGVRSAGVVRREKIGPTSQAALAAASGEPTEPTAGAGGSMTLAALDDATIAGLVEFRELPEQWPIVGIDIRMLGGALRSPHRDGFASLSAADWLLHALVPVIPGVPAEPGMESLAGLRRLLAPHEAPQIIPTFLSPGQGLDRCGSPDDLRRLRAVRQAADPQAVLHEGRLPR
ncbi:hypothetical protein [Microbacterium sp. XT11]|uniref:hypothetical protein n=1 Tax=Microbacterium sp. XT11 TaxID=367477 RepID=UPI00082B5086|nr:hypothetical protein [Microbacterium sp. XT11]